MPYIELHARSAFSFLAGASLPESLAYACVQRELPAMALLDRSGVYGSARFHVTAKANNIKAHVGAEISVLGGLGSPGSSYYPLVVQSRKGYQNLCRLITKTKLRALKNTPTAATLPELEEQASGLLCLTGDEDGPLAQALYSGGKAEGRYLLEHVIHIFGPGNVYVELQRHFRPDQEYRNHAAIELARELKVPLLATNGVLYATPSDSEVLDALTCIKNKCTLDTAGTRLQVNSKRHVRSNREMAQIFADLPEAIAHTTELSSRLEFTLENLGYRFPPYRVPEGGTEIEFLRAEVLKGAHDRYRSITEKVRRQLERELILI